MKKSKSLLKIIALATMLTLTACGPTASTESAPASSNSTPSEVSTPADTSSQNASTPDVSTPEVSSPEVSTPEVSTPEVSTPEISSPEISSPEISSPEVSSPEESTPAESSSSEHETGIETLLGTLEFEGATHYSPTGTWGGGWGSDPYTTPVLNEDGCNASGGSYLGNMAAGCKETLSFTASKAGTVKLGFIMASTAMDMTTFSSISDVTIADVMTITVNGIALDLTGKILPGSDTLNWYNWQEVELTGVALNNGGNTIVVEITGSQGPNLDCVKVYGSGITITAGEGGSGPETPTTDVVGKYTYFVDGYAFGPGVRDLMIDFEGKNVSASELNKDLFSVKSTGSQGAAREVTDVYLCDADGNKISATSGSRIIIEMKITVGFFGFSYNGCDPFSYSQQTALNTWATDYHYEVTQKAGTTLTIGTTTYSGSNLMECKTAAATEKVIRATKDWGTAKSYTADGKTLMYKAYETDTLKNDNAKNPLIIWLHGQGEGGTDPDIAILGNDVTNLGEEKIQSYFKKDGAEQGAYVLAVQSPTMWMDNGSGQNHGGGAKSIYTTALKATIDNYIANNTDVDSNRVYIGGCSNGGYMTVNMITAYPSFFAAAYPICEAYQNAFLTDAEVTSIKDMPLWFVASADDTTVNPDNFVKPTFKRLRDAGGEDVHFSFFEHVYGTDTGSQVQYMGHWSWIYAFEDKVIKDIADVNNITAPSTADVKINNKNVGLWEWLSHKTKSAA